MRDDPVLTAIASTGAGVDGIALLPMIFGINPPFTKTGHCVGTSFMRKAPMSFLPPALLASRTAAALVAFGLLAAPAQAPTRPCASIWTRRAC